MVKVTNKYLYFYIDLYINNTGHLNLLCINQLLIYETLYIV